MYGQVQSTLLPLLTKEGEIKGVRLLNSFILIISGAGTFGRYHAGPDRVFRCTGLAE
jgi:hypothetical protein